MSPGPRVLRCLFGIDKITLLVILDLIIFVGPFLVPVCSGSLSNKQIQTGKKEYG
jgi:hypothetical protein